MPLFDFPLYLDLAVLPLDEWPGAMRPVDQRTTSSFRAEVAKTYRTLSTELFQLDATDRRLYVPVPRGNFRADGRIRLDVKAPAHSGIVLEFDSAGAHYQYPADRFVSWQENLRAIALTLEHLRAVARYGLTDRKQQYEGFKAIESGSVAAPAFVNAEAALAFLRDFAQDPADISDPRKLLRLAQRATHPDAVGGDENSATYRKVALAEQVLRREAII